MLVWVWDGLKIGEIEYGGGCRQKRIKIGIRKMKVNE